VLPGAVGHAGRERHVCVGTIDGHLRGPHPPPGGSERAPEARQLPARADLGSAAGCWHRHGRLAVILAWPGLI
jgi:hypothetical protein